MSATARLKTAGKRRLKTAGRGRAGGTLNFMRFIVFRSCFCMCTRPILWPIPLDSLFLFLPPIISLFCLGTCIAISQSVSGRRQRAAAARRTRIAALRMSSAPVEMEERGKMGWTDEEEEVVVVEGTAGESNAEAVVVVVVWRRQQRRRRRRRSLQSWLSWRW
jgi:hypothetical protein